MDLYFSNVAGNDGDNAANWFEDNVTFAVPHLSVPASGDTAYISSGICSGFTFSCDAIYVGAGTTLSTNTGIVTGNNGTITDNNGLIETNASGGIVTNNSGTVTTNASGGSILANSGTITTNSGDIQIGIITGGSGTLSAAATTNLASHAAGTNVTLPSGSGLTWW